MPLSKHAKNVLHVDVSRVSEIARRKKILSLVYSSPYAIAINNLVKSLAKAFFINRMDYPFLCIPQSRSGKGGLTVKQNCFLRQQTLTHHLVVNNKVTSLQKNIIIERLGKLLDVF